MLSLCLTTTCSSVVAMDRGTASDHISQAQLDLKQGHWHRALARFRWLLLEGAPDAQYEIAYQNTIATITNNHPLRFSFDAAILPSTNISKASSHRVFITEFGEFLIDSADDRESGVGLRTGATATYTQSYQPGRNLFVSGLVSAHLYGQKELQAGQTGLTFGHEWISAGSQTGLSISRTRFRYRDIADRDAPDFTSDAITFNTYRRFNPRLALSTQSLVRRATYQDRSYNDGIHASFHMIPKYQLSAQNAVSLKLGIQDVDIEANHLSYSGQSFGLFWDRKERNGLSWGIGLEHHLRDYDSRFPGLSVNREDRISDVILSASHARIDIYGVTPVLRCTLRNHRSNISLYDYKSKDCSVSLNYNF